MATLVRFTVSCPLQANGSGDLVRYEDYAALERKYLQLLQEATPEVSLRDRILEYIGRYELGITRSEIIHALGEPLNEVYLCLNSLRDAGEITPGPRGFMKVVK